MVTGAIGPAGGSLELVASDGGKLDLLVPAAAVAASTNFTIEEISISGLAGRTSSLREA